MFEEFLKKIINTNSYTVICYLIEDKLKQQPSEEETTILNKLMNENKLDLIYAHCHEALGDHEIAAKLREYVQNKKNKTESFFLV